jgi:hypothetical protein
MIRIPRGVSLVIASILAISVSTARRAEAEPTGIVVVTGKIGPHERSVIESAIKTALRRASWSLSAQQFTPKETETILRCLADDKPWHCLGPVMQPKGVDRLVVAEVNPQPDSASKLVITGEFVVAGNGAAAVLQRRCDSCDDTRLADTAERLAEALLADMDNQRETLLELQIVPAGATVRLDDQPLGATNAAGQLTHATLPGPHKLSVQHPGFLRYDRDVDLPVAKTTHVDVHLTSVETKHSLLIPLAVTGVGVAALATGIAVQLAADAPSLRAQQHKYIVSTPGVILMAGGSAAIGLGVYLWLCTARTTASAGAPVAAIIDRGGVIGWTGQF